MSFRLIFSCLLFCLVGVAAEPESTPMPGPLTGKSLTSNCPYLRGRKDVTAQSLLKALSELRGILNQRCQDALKNGAKLQTSLVERQSLIQQQLANQNAWRLSGGKGAPPVSNDSTLIMQDVGNQASQFFTEAADCIGADGPQKIRDRLVDVAVQTADVLSAFSMGGGMASAGVALGGDLLAGVMGKLFSPDGSFNPASAQDSGVSDSYACLYMSMFTRLAGCEAKGAAKPFDANLKYPHPEMEAFMFGDHAQGSSFRKLTTAIREIGRRKPEDVSSDMTSDPLLKDLHDTMRSEVTFYNKKVKMRTLLGSFADGIRKLIPPREDVEHREDRRQLLSAWLQLDKFLKAYDGWVAGPRPPPGGELDEEAELQAYEKLSKALITSVAGAHEPDDKEKGKEKKDEDKKDEEKKKLKPLDLDAIIGLFYDHRYKTPRNAFRDFLAWEQKQPDQAAYEDSLLKNYEIGGHRRPESPSNGGPKADDSAKDLGASFRGMLQYVKPIFTAQLHHYDVDYNANIGNKGQPGRKLPLWETYHAGDGIRALRTFIRYGYFKAPRRNPTPGEALRNERLAFFSQSVLPYANYCLLASAYIMSDRKGDNPFFRLADPSGDAFLLPHKKELESYRTACRMFDCRASQGWDGIKMFDEPIVPGGEDSDQVSRFKAQQCEVVRGYDDTMEKLLTNFLQYGYPCGQKPGGQVPGSEEEKKPNLERNHTQPPPERSQVSEPPGVTLGNILPDDGSQP